MNDIWESWLHVRHDVTLVFGLVLAVLTTIHVLMNKREVASSVGWIGLVWFAPILGAVLYLMFGINRVRRRARRPDGPAVPALGGNAGAQEPADRGFAMLVGSVAEITGRPLTHGNTVRMFRDGDAAYPPMLAAIEGAKRSVGMCSYIFRDDLWGGRFIDAAAAAAKRGVEVRVLIDGIGGGWVGSPAYRRLTRLGVPAARFMHSLLPWRMPFVNLRTHRKILVVDGAVGFAGGMNIADENVQATHPPHPVRDLHFRLEGPVVGQLVEAFLDDWTYATGETVAPDAWLPEPGTAAALPRGAPAGVPARVIDSGPDADIEKIEFSILQAVTCAQRSIAIMTPYFLPDERLVTALALAAMRGVTVDVTIPARSNHRLVDWGTRANVGPLLEAGVRIWQSPAPFHHAKTMVVDNAWCLIGSCNWDIRSFRLNFEICVEAYDPQLARDLLEPMAENRGPALTMADLAARMPIEKLRDAAARLLLPYL
ncbi:MAG: PLDc N-terminal domain-containing protein [Proteobacteria bacterium]|nr:PLDc N-terminal domain-containing protein [Pseudomonadota bacterium]